MSTSNLEYFLFDSQSSLREYQLIFTDWKDTARYVITVVERCQYIGVTEYGAIIGTNRPEQLEEYLQVAWQKT